MHRKKSTEMVWSREENGGGRETERDAGMETRRNETSGKTKEEMDGSGRRSNTIKEQDTGRGGRQSNV